MILLLLTTAMSSFSLIFFIAHYAGLAGVSALSAISALGVAGASGKFAVATSPTGVGLVGGGVAAAGALVTAAAAGVVSIGSLAMMIRSANNFGRDMNHLNSVISQRPWNAQTGDRTPGGREFSTHAAEQANARRYSPSDIDNIIDNWTHKRYQPGGRSVYIRRSGTNSYDVVVMDRNGRTIISVVGGNVNNGIKNSLPDMPAVRRMLENQGGYSTIPLP